MTGEWRPMSSSLGVVRGRAWNSRLGRAVPTLRRGWRGVVTLDGARPHQTRVCGHAHLKRRRADECAAAWARALNSTVEIAASAATMTLSDGERNQTPCT